MAKAPNILETQKRLRAALVKRELEATGRVVDSYRIISKRLQGDIEALILKIDAMEGATPGQLQKMAQYKRLMDNLQGELEKYTGTLDLELQKAAESMIGYATTDARTLAKVSAGGIGLNNWNTLNPEVIKTLLGFLDPKGALYKRLGLLSGWTAEQVKAKIIEGLGMGWNPKKTAGMLAQAINDALGMSLTDAMRTMRTVQLWSYREATRANYIANSDVVSGWIWIADLEGDPCPACIAMHGTEHTNDEVLDDHYNGRCAMVPITITNPNLAEQVGTGQDWFDSLPESKQEELLGAKGYEAYKGGAALSEFVHNEPNDVYGSMTMAKNPTGDE